MSHAELHADASWETDELESYQALVSLHGNGETSTYVVLARDEADASFKVGVCVTLDHGARAAEYVIEQMFSQREFEHDAEQDRQQELHDEMLMNTPMYWEG